MKKETNTPVYHSPQAEVVDIVVERGFQDSPTGQSLQQFTTEDEEEW